jgi:hypothetical protein
MSHNTVPTLVMACWLVLSPKKKQQALLVLKDQHYKHINSPAKIQCYSCDQYYWANSLSRRIMKLNESCHEIMPCFCGNCKLHVQRFGILCDKCRIDYMITPTPINGCCAFCTRCRTMSINGICIDCMQHIVDELKNQVQRCEGLSGKQKKQLETALGLTKDSIF